VDESLYADVLLHHGSVCTHI